MGKSYAVTARCRVDFVPNRATQRPRNSLTRPSSEVTSPSTGFSTPYPTHRPSAGPLPIHLQTGWQLCINASQRLLKQQPYCAGFDRLAAIPHEESCPAWKDSKACRGTSTSKSCTPPHSRRHLNQIHILCHAGQQGSNRVGCKMSPVR